MNQTHEQTGTLGNAHEKTEMEKDQPQPKEMST